MTLIQAFCNDPKTFMEKHVVRVGIPESEMGPLLDVSVVDLTEREGLKVMNDPTARVFGLYKKEDRTKGGPSIPAYWCPYKQDDLKAISLGNGALYCFTQPMNGCTFGVGSHSSGGVQRVAHVNTAKIGASTAHGGIDRARDHQRGLQRAWLIQELGGNVKIIEPNAYMSGYGDPNTLEATTFGLHPLDRAWQFFTLRYTQIGKKTYLHAGVHPA